MLVRMRIAILHYSKPPVIGGVERVIGEQAAALTAMGHEVRVWSADESSAFREMLGDESSPLQTPFLHPQRRINKHRHILPHWHHDGVWCFITWRLADSLPQEFIQGWMNRRDAWLRDHPKPWEPEVEAEYHQRFSGRYLDLLDQGLGSCLLRQKACADAVEQVLQFFNGTRYTLKSYVVMPNHVHVLVRLHDGWPLERIVQNWKERSAKAINAALGSAGMVWQKGYFDRLIRSVPHCEFVNGYIHRNPEKARLKNGFRLWSADESSPFKLGRATSRRPSIVIVHNVFTMPFNLAWTEELIALTHSRPDIRWINWVHDVRWTEKVPQALHIAVSEHRKAEYAKITRDPIHVIPNGCDPKAILGLTDRIASLDLEKAGLVLLHPTRFVRRKNIEMGLRVLAELPRAVYLVTAAPDPHQKDGLKYFRELKRLAKDLGVAKRVHFLGEKDVLADDDVRSLYQMADALFFPSTQEGYGLPLVEAAIHQTPVFCSDIPAHREVAPSDATFFKLHAPPKGLARKIKSHPAVKARQARRALMARVDWKKIAVASLEPLINGEASQQT
jgi:glycosyltransferase involved in cell wall biosynthesis